MEKLMTEKSPEDFVRAQLKHRAQGIFDAIVGGLILIPVVTGAALLVAKWNDRAIIPNHPWIASFAITQIALLCVAGAYRHYIVKAYRRSITTLNDKNALIEQQRQTIERQITEIENKNTRIVEQVSKIEEEIERADKTKSALDKAELFAKLAVCRREASASLGV